MKLQIERVENGYILSWKDDGVVNKRVFSYILAEAECVRTLLYSVMDCIGYAPSRYEKERIYIEIRPGGKCPDYEEHA